MNISLVELVWDRAHQCCEYCQMPHAYDELPFETDHVVAEQHGGKTAQLIGEGVFPPVPAESP